MNNHHHHLAIKAFGGVLLLLIVMGALLFLPAGTFNYWQAWVFLVVFGTSALAVTGYLKKNDPRLLERRLSGGPTAEQKTSEKIIMSIVSVEFVALLVFPAIDHRFAWSSVPPYVAVGGDALVVLGWVAIFVVFRANTFAAATIQVATDQTVISTGPYALVRHPMYSGSLLYILGMPIALGSWWGIFVALLMIFTIIWRLLDEEEFLKQNLPGYTQYCQKVQYRLIPFVW